MRPDPEVVQQVVHRIVERVRPLEIILFGSAARGEMGPDSDLDVLVVMPEGTHRRRTAQDLHRVMFGIPVAVDILVSTPSVLEELGSNAALVYRDALREGRVLYAV